MSVTGAGASPGSKRDRLKQLRAFCEVARLGSISRAAKTLHSSQPAISGQVRALEAELGIPLFGRKGPRIVLTRAGERLYESARLVVHGLLRLPELFAEVHYGAHSQRLRIGAGGTSAAYLLPRPIERFQALHPGIRIIVRIGSGRERLEWLRTFEVDAVVSTSASGFRYHPFHTSSMVLVVPMTYPLARHGPLPLAPRELAHLPLIAPVSGQAVRWLHDTLFHLHGIEPRVLVEVNGWGAILNHVAAGVGAAFVPDFCVTESESVRIVPVDVPPVRRIYGMLVRRDGLVSQTMNRFVEMLVQDTRGAGEAP